MDRMWSLTPSSVWSADSVTTGMPASRNCWSTSGGPRLSSVRITLGFRPRIVSADRSVPEVVTRGKSLAASNVVAISRPTTFAPRPRLNTISAIEPYRLTGRMRLTSVTVTSRPSADRTVTGSTGLGGGVRGSRALTSTSAVEGPQSALGSVVSPEAAGLGANGATEAIGGARGRGVAYR